MYKKIIALLSSAVLVLGSMAVSFAAPQDRMTSSPVGAIRKTPDENIFIMENSSEKFIMLDYNEDGFYILSTKNIGRYVFDSDNIAKFDPEDENNIAYTLNNQYLNEGVNGQKLPQAILDHLVERDWEVEAGVPGCSFDEDFTVRAKVALMSMTEWKKYYKNFGAWDDESWWGWFLRTSWGGDAVQSTENAVLAVSGENAAGPIVIVCPAEKACGIRPVYYIDREFFTSVKCNVNTMGVGVRKWLCKVYSDEELSKLYTAAEIKSIHADVPPKAMDVWAIGYRNVGDTLKGYYKFYQEDGLPEDGTTVRWVRSDELNGAVSLIPGTQGKFSYTLQDADAGKYVWFEVTPAIAGTVGNPYRQTLVEGATVGAAQKPIAKDIKLFGIPAVGKEIGVKYTYYDANRELEEGTTFQWQRKKGGQFTDIEGATDKYYTVTQEDAGCEIRVCIVPQNKGRYRLAPPYNDGRCAVGDPFYSESVNAVTLPEALNVKINRTAVSFQTTVENNKISMSLLKNESKTVGGQLIGTYEYNDMLGIAEKDSKFSWELSADGVCWLPIYGAKSTEYAIHDGDAGKYIRFAVEARDKEGTIGEKRYSEPIIIEDVLRDEKEIDFAQISVNNKQEITLSARELENAYAVSFEIELSEGQVSGIESDGYNTYVIGTNPAKCILTKQGIAAVNDRETDLAIIKFAAPYNGMVKIKNFRTAGIINEKADYEKLPSEITIN